MTLVVLVVLGAMGAMGQVVRCLYLLLARRGDGTYTIFPPRSGPRGLATLRVHVLPIQSPSVGRGWRTLPW